jgi:hypothetical protein
VHETPSTLLIKITYCNNENDGTLGTQLRLSEYESENWIFTPGATVHGQGTTFARLISRNLEAPITISEYRAQLYSNHTGLEVATFPFQYTKEWSNVQNPDTLATRLMKLGIGM